MPTWRRSGGSDQPGRPTASPAMRTVPSSSASKPATRRSKRGLAATGRAEQRQELAVGDREVDAIDGSGRAEALRDLLEPYARHGTTPSGRLRPSRLTREARPSVTPTETVASAAAAGELPS